MRFMPTLVPRTEPQSTLAAAQGLLLLDLQGRVCHCCPDLAALIGATVWELIGKHVRKLLPSVPLNAQTPGYNAAWACFRPDGAAARDARLRIAGGYTVAVAIDSALVRVHRERVIMLRIQARTANIAKAIGSAASAFGLPRRSAAVTSGTVLALPAAHPKSGAPGEPSRPGHDGAHSRTHRH